MNVEEITYENMPAPHRKLYDYMLITEPYATHMKFAENVSSVRKMVIKAYPEYENKFQANLLKEAREMNLERSSTTFVRHLSSIIYNLNTKENNK